jgi:hypothetical protein
MRSALKMFPATKAAPEHYIRDFKAKPEKKKPAYAWHGRKCDMEKGLCYETVRIFHTWSLGE